MKYLGIDYGTKNIGLALSDENGSIAFPYKVIPKNDALKYITELLLQEKISGIVLGDPGEHNQIHAHIIEFKKHLDELAPVWLEKEFMTSFHASLHEKHSRDDGRRKDTTRNEKKDHSAAALILQRFLDRK